MAGRVTVIGAGVVGLSCAVRLAESGMEVNVLARDLPLETTSAAGGGLWLPSVSGWPQDADRWALDTLAELTRLATADREGGDHAVPSGVRTLPGTLLFRTATAPQPAWGPAISDHVTPGPVRQPAPGYGSGLRLSVPLVHLPRYLTHLIARLRAAGGTLTRLALPALPTRGTVVNCTGVSARALTPDRAVRAVRSQVAVLADPGLDEWWYGQDSRDLTYVLPHGRDVLIGATLDDGDWGTTPDGDAARRLIDRACRLVPALRDAEVVAHRVGLRPARPRVRLEVERLPTSEDPDHVRLHCYGHGGDGVTLSWGCAGDVTRLVRDLVAQPAPTL